jgi:hypothetical protein
LPVAFLDRDHGYMLAVTIVYDSATLAAKGRPAAILV